MKYFFLKNWHKIVNKKKYKQLKLKESTEKKIKFYKSNIENKIDTIHEEIKHVLSHQIIHARFFEIIIVGGFESDYLKVSLGDINKYPVPILIGNYIEQHISSVSV